MFVSLTRDPGKVEFPIYAIRGIEKYAEEGNGLGEKARESEREREREWLNLWTVKLLCINTQKLFYL